MRLSLFSFFSLVLCSFSCPIIAQEVLSYNPSEEFNLCYPEKLSVIVNKGARMKLINYEEAQYIFKYSSQNLTIPRHITQFCQGKDKVLKEDKELTVLCFSNICESFDYDSYLVWTGKQKGRIIYVVSREDVLDNSYLDSINNRRREIYKELKEKLSLCIRIRDSVFYAKSDSINHVIDRFSYLEANRQTIIDSVISLIQDSINIDYQKWYNNQTNEVKEALRFINKLRVDNLVPNSAGGCDFYLKYRNSSPKTIKYLFWYGKVYNAVGDPVSCTIRGTSSVSGKETGPIEPDEDGGGTWDCIIYNYSARFVRLSKITITYMDGTSKTLNAVQIKALLQEPKTFVPRERYEQEERKLISNWQIREILKKALLYKEKLYDHKYEELEGGKENMLYLANLFVLQTEKEVEAFNKRNYVKE